MFLTKIIANCLCTKLIKCSIYHKTFCHQEKERKKKWRNKFRAKKNLVGKGSVFVALFLLCCCLMSLSLECRAGLDEGLLSYLYENLLQEAVRWIWLPSKNGKYCKDDSTRPEKPVASSFLFERLVKYLFSYIYSLKSIASQFSEWILCQNSRYTGRNTKTFNGRKQFTNLTQNWLLVRNTISRMAYKYYISSDTVTLPVECYATLKM